VTATAADTARRLWERGGGSATSPEEAGAAAQRVCDELRGGLSRWVGAEGYRALLDRALALSVTEHPVLKSISCYDGDVLAAVAAARMHGAGQLATGVVTLVSTLTELLGRIVGEEIAVQLVERAGTPGPPAGSNTDGRRGRNG
jgi:hypothetical protein